MLSQIDVRGWVWVVRSVAVAERGKFSSLRPLRLGGESFSLQRHSVTEPRRKCRRRIPLPRLRSGQAGFFAAVPSEPLWLEQFTAETCLRQAGAETAEEIQHRGLSIILSFRGGCPPRRACLPQAGCAQNDNRLKTELAQKADSSAIQPRNDIPFLSGGDTGGLTGLRQGSLLRPADFGGQVGRHALEVDGAVGGVHQQDAGL